MVGAVESRTTTTKDTHADSALLEPPGLRDWSVSQGLACVNALWRGQRDGSESCSEQSEEGTGEREMAGSQ